MCNKFFIRTALIVWIILGWGNIGSGDELNEESIPETPVEYAGEVGLELMGRVEIPFDEETPGIGEVQWMGFSSEGTLLLTDFTARQAHEFSLDDGHYIRSFGRRGSGPGEYGSAYNMAVDPQGKVYLLDSTRGQILRYDRQGQYLNQMRSFRTSRVLTGRGGEVFVLKVNAVKILEVQRLDPATWEVVYRTPLSTDKQRFISFRMSPFAHLCYSTARHRLYYLGPNDYKVKEIDAETGEVVRQSGRSPEGFMSLPRRYHGIGRGTREDMQDLLREISSLRSMTLLKDQYLLISHFTLSSVSWVVYDLSSTTKIKAYDFNRDAKELLASFRGSIPWRDIAAWKDRLYIWRSPSEEAAETSNGTVEVYALTFATQ